MSKLIRQVSTLLCLFLLGCAAAPPPAAPTPPPVVTAAVAPVDQAPPPGAAAPAKGALSDAREAAALEADGDEGAQGSEGAAFGVVGRGIGQPAGGAAPRGVAPPAAAAAAAGGGDVGVEAVAASVSAADPQWGNKDALVTLVQFGDFQCPFCGKAEQTLTDLRKTYGPDKLRIVWKNSPLPFHPNARPTAELAMVLFQRDGNSAFWAAHDDFFANQRDLPLVSAQVMQRAGISPADLTTLLATGKAAAKVDADMAEGKAAGATGTPAFFINGILLSGAQPVDRFTAIIDEQLQKAKAAIAAGTPPAQVYAKLSKEQKSKIAPRPPSPAPVPADETTVHPVPVGSSPVRGKATALVTLVEFADFQCPFCSRVEVTVQKLSALYGDKLRVVWKNEPLPFHVRAEPAAQLALEARAQKGDAAFFKVHDALFADQQHLDDTDLATLAASVGLDPVRAMSAVMTHKHKAILDVDQDLADDLKANGTPHFFINGRRLVGAQPLEKFKAIIDEEIVKAEALIKAGTPAGKVYDKIQASAQPITPEKKAIPAPGKQNPGRGPESAKVLVQYFCDFQTPYCARAEPTLVELEKAFPGKIRVVWRHRPLAFHTNARLASEAAMEAFKQKGAAGFWGMHDLLFANPGQAAALERPALDGYAARLGLDLTAFASALDNQTHKAEVEADEKIADAAGVNGLPAFFVNGYYLPGVVSIGRFKKVVNLALSGK